MKYLITPLLLLSLTGTAFSQKKDSAQLTISRMKSANDARLQMMQATIKKLQLTLEQAVTLIDQLRDEKKSLGSLSQQEIAVLQQLMEQKAQLEKMISNVMKAASEVQAGIKANLKAS